MLLIGPQGGLDPAAWRTAALGLWMAVWWASEAIPVFVTAFIPLVAFDPLGIAPIRDAAAPYANPIIYLFLGGFMMALALEKWNHEVDGGREEGIPPHEERVERVQKAMPEILEKPVHEGRHG